MESPMIKQFGFPSKYVFITPGLHTLDALMLPPSGVTAADGDCVCTGWLAMVGPEFSITEGGSVVWTIFVFFFFLDETVFLCFALASGLPEIGYRWCISGTGIPSSGVDVSPVEPFTAAASEIALEWFLGSPWFVGSWILCTTEIEKC